ncbi:MAG: hypothetical protein NWF14_05135 [Candidatus Bathyarchaeota archaeon]|nr:hypothetical protein [Candidatus Bathyarchaeota archaeon]
MSFLQRGDLNSPFGQITNSTTITLGSAPPRLDTVSESWLTATTGDASSYDIGANAFVSAFFPNSTSTNLFSLKFKDAPITQWGGIVGSAGASRSHGDDEFFDYRDDTSYAFGRDLASVDPFPDKARFNVVRIEAT